jgi:hypothetical protein
MKEITMDKCWIVCRIVNVSVDTDINKSHEIKVFEDFEDAFAYEQSLQLELSEIFGDKLSEYYESGKIVLYTRKFDIY